MAVYTQVSSDQLTKFLLDYDLGTVAELRGINGGIENTNYFLTTVIGQQKSEYVLTLLEELGRDEAPFFVELGNWLAERHIPVSYAIPDRNGIGLKNLAQKPAIIQPRYAGEHISRKALSADHCSQIGAELARFHIAAEGFYMQRQAHRGVFWWRRESSRLTSKLPSEDSELLKTVVADFDLLRTSNPDLPLGIIHGDLFHDNALFHQGKLTAILDIYNAATAFWLYDLAIVANDWCINQDLKIDQTLEQALLTGYSQVRPFNDAEHQHWPLLTRTAAMRFWLSRLVPWIEAQEGQTSKTLKDPHEYKQILINRIEKVSSLS